MRSSAVNRLTSRHLTIYDPCGFEVDACSTERFSCRYWNCLDLEVTSVTISAARNDLSLLQYSLLTRSAPRMRLVLTVSQVTLLQFYYRSVRFSRLSVSQLPMA